MDDLTKAKYFRLLDFYKQINSFFRNLEESGTQVYRAETQISAYEKQCERILNDKTMDKEVKKKEEDGIKKGKEQIGAMLEQANYILDDAIDLITKRIEQGVK